MPVQVSPTSTSSRRKVCQLSSSLHALAAFRSPPYQREQNGASLLNGRYMNMYDTYSTTTRRLSTRINRQSSASQKKPAESDSHPIVLSCIVSLAPTDAGVAVAAQASDSITTLPSNGSPPTSLTNCRPEILQGVTMLASAFLHRLPDPALAAWVDVGVWIAPGPAVVLRGPKGKCRRRCHSANFFGQAD